MGQQLYHYLFFCAVGQTQNGFVKTRGRIVNGQHIYGKGLVGATVQIKGRSSVVVRNSNGFFSFPTPEKQFIIQSVKKNGYQLVDADATPKTYSFSSNPIYLVMDIPSQQMEDKLAAERKLRRTLSRQLQQREDEIEQLKEQNKLTEEQYHKALQDLYAEQERSLNLVSQMAERYSKMDFDQLDELNRQVSECIIEGRLTEADSLIKSKGNLITRIDVYNKHHEANIKARKQLEDSEAMELKDREDLAVDCYNQFIIHKLQHHPDSAAYYIEQRALLDTTNVDWLYEAACFIANIGNLDKALSMFMTAHLISVSSYQYSVKDGFILKNIAQLYRSKGQAYHEQAINYYEMASDAFKRSENPEEQMKCYSILSILSFSALEFGDRGEREQYRRDLKAKMLQLQDSVYSSVDALDINNLYYNFQNIYLSEKNRFAISKKAIDYYERALHQTQSLYGNNSYETAKLFISLGKVYRVLLDSAYHNDKMDSYFDKATSILTEIDSANLLLANLYDERSSFFQERGQYVSKDKKDLLKSIDYKIKAVDIWRSLYGDVSLFISDKYQQIAELYSLMEKYSVALEYYFKVHGIVSRIFGNSNKLSENYGDISTVYEKMGDYDLSIKYLKLQIQFQECAFTNSNSSINGAIINLDTHPASCYRRLGDIYFLKEDYTHALEAYKVESEIDLSLRPEKKNPIFHDGIAKTYLAMKDYSNAFDCYISYVSELESVFSKYHKEFPASAISNMNFGKKCREQGNFITALKSLKNTLKDVYEELCKPEYDDSFETQFREYYEKHGNDEESESGFSVSSVWDVWRHRTEALIGEIQNYIPETE